MPPAHRFAAPLDRRIMGENRRGTLIYNVVWLPAATTEALGLGAKGRCRIRGTLDGEAIRLAVSPAKEGGHYLIVSKALMKLVGKDVGDPVEVAFDVDDADAVAIPEALREGLEGDRTAAAVWSSLTPGKQRIWTTHVERAKRPQTQRRRVAEVLGRLRTGQLDPRRKYVGRVI